MGIPESKSTDATFGLAQRVPGAIAWDATGFMFKFAFERKFAFDFDFELKFEFTFELTFELEFA